MCVCIDLEGGCWATVCLHSNIVTERVLARTVGIGSLFERQTWLCLVLGTSGARTETAVPHEEKNQHFRREGS